MNIPVVTNVTQEAVRFFSEHAGLSRYPWEDESLARHRCAVAHAEAEFYAQRHFWEYEVCEDPDVMQDDAGSVEMVASGEYVNLGMILRNEEGDHLASLWSIVVKSEDDPYLRVVAAELAMEAGA